MSGLDDKATACEMLVCYARELKHGFVNYLEETVKILVPLLKYYFHEDILFTEIINTLLLMIPILLTLLAVFVYFP